MTASFASARLSRFEQFGLGLLTLVIIGFGVLVVVRSAFQNDRKTDFGVYARAGYAIRADLDLYEVCDDRGWHYCYPPTFAIFMVPLADPYPWDQSGFYLPFWLSVGIWYALNILLLAYIADTLARFALPDAQLGTRRWWYARLMPFYLCIGGIGYTLSRGQVNILLVGTVTALFATTVRGRSLLTGFWLAAAVALKVIPGLLVLFPLIRRDWKAILGAILGGLFWLGLLPAVVWGVPQAWNLNLQMVQVVLTPGATGGGDQTRKKELTGAVATDSQSFQSVFHAWQYPDRASRPQEVAKPIRLAHWLLGGVLTLLTILIAWRKPARTAADTLIFLGLLSVLMLLLTPVSHMHYYMLAWPLVAGLWSRSLQSRPEAVWADRGTFAALLGWCALTNLPLLPIELFMMLRDLGLSTFATVGLWLFGLIKLAQPDSR